MSFDVSLFSKMEKQDPQFYFNDSLDVSSLKILYDNCMRMGSGDNSNVEMATVHPDIWFGEYFDFFRKKVKMVVKGPLFQLVQVEGNKLEEFLENQTEYGSIAIFCLVKWLNVKTLAVTWNLKYKDISTKEEIRNKKISTIL
jgi:hypothetical protein